MSASTLSWANCEKFLQEIESTYGRVPVFIGAENHIKIPYNHWIFKYWRSRTPESVPNTAFGFYFLSHEQKLRWISQESVKQLSTKTDESITKPNFNVKGFWDIENNMNNTKIWQTVDGIAYSSLYLFVEIDGHEKLVGFNANSHGEAAHILRETTQATTITGGFIKLIFKEGSSHPKVVDRIILVGSGTAMIWKQGLSRLLGFLEKAFPTSGETDFIIQDIYGELILGLNLLTDRNRAIKGASRISTEPPMSIIILNDM